MEKTLKQIEKTLLLAVVVLYPLAVFSLFPDIFTTIKITVLVLGTALALLMRVIRLYSSGKFELRTGKFDFPILILLLAYLLSGILKTPNKMEAFFLPGTATLVIFGGLLYFLLNQLDRKSKNVLPVALFLSGILVSFSILFSFAKLFEKIPTLPVYMQDPSFNLMGGSLPAIIFLGVLIPLGVGLVASNKEIVSKIFFSVATFILTLGLSIAVYNSQPGKPTSFRTVDYKTSWIVAIDSLKESPLLGTGPGNYLSAFDRFKGIEYNQTDLWNFKFVSAKSHYLTILTETGFLGILGATLLLIAVYKKVGIEKRNFPRKNLSKNVSLLVLILFLAVFPASAAIIITLFVLLAINSSGKRSTLNLMTKGTKRPFAMRIPSFLASVPIVVLLAGLFYFGLITLSAEAKFKKATDALSQNNAQKTYNYLREAINTNPYMDKYRIGFAQVDLALAGNIAQALSAQEDGADDQKRSDIAQLIQQALAESKSAVVLNRQRAGNWEFLAQTYQTIMAFAQGADQFTISSYNQAIALDPVNPNLRIALGGVYYALGDFDNAIETFKLAVLAKPDLANAHYNLALAYREKGETEKAISEMTIVLSLIEGGTPDYNLAKSELENLEQKSASQVTQEPEELTPPKKQEPAIDPPIELPEDLSP